MRVLQVAGMLLAMAAQGADSSRPVTRSAGLDESSKTAYVLISLDGAQAGMKAEGSSPPPRLTAVCTRNSQGKLKFELMANLGGVTEIGYYPPWRPRSKEDLFPPPLEKVQVAMEFLGYTKVKPVKRWWEYLPTMAGELRYAAPGLGSANMEEIAFYLQYLRALPTLRLTVPGKGTAEWQTAAWQQAVHAEPLCGASGL